MAEGRSRGFEIFDTHHIANFCDFIAVNQYGVLFAEVKAQGKKLSDSQLDLWDSLLYPDHWVVAYSWADVENKYRMLYGM